MVDTHALGACAARLGSSSLPLPTKITPSFVRGIFLRQGAPKLLSGRGDLKGAAMFLFESELCEDERQKRASRGREIFLSGKIFVT